MITEDYVSFETAKLLKEKGFPQSTFRCHYIIDGNVHYKSFENRCGFGDYDIIAPTLQMAMKWLREVHSVYYDIQLLLGSKAEKYGDLQLGVYRLNSSGAYEWKCWLYADTYKELYEKYIKYCLKN